MEKKELKKYSVKTKFFRAITYGVLVLLALICIVPFYNMIINCTHDNAALATSFQMTPGKSLKTNYQHLAANVNIWRGLLNSLFISLASTVITVYVGALTAYGFAKYKFKYNKQLFWLVLATMMLPGQLGIIGYFQLMNNIHMLDNYAALLITCFAPPAVATQAIFTFVESWNAFVKPSILLFSQDKFTLPILVQQMQGVYKNDYGTVYIGVALSVIPILIMFVLCSRRILEGATAGAVKG